MDTTGYEVELCRLKVELEQLTKSHASVTDENTTLRKLLKESSATGGRRAVAKGCSKCGDWYPDWSNAKIHICRRCVA